MTELSSGILVHGSDKMFVPFMKIDEEQHMVWGYASTETRDQQKEIVRLSALKSALPDYMRFANIREMHQPSAVGTAEEAAVDQKGLWLGAHVVDDRAWDKVKKKVYKGFSIGGKVTARDAIDRSIITALDLTEISLVDRPANPDAVFTVVKRVDGKLKPQPVQKWDCGCPEHMHIAKDDASFCMEQELLSMALLKVERNINMEPFDLGWFSADGDWFGKREFSDKERQAAADSGAAMPDGSFPIKNKSDLHNAVQAIGRAKNPAKAKAHIKARAHALGAEGDLPDSWKADGADNDVGKATQELDTGRFTNHSGAAADANTKAKFHEDAHTSNLKTADKHRRLAEQATANADQVGLITHDRIATSSATVADAHKKLAEHYRNLAAQHDAATTKGADMTTRTIADATRDAENAVTQLAEVTDSISKTTTDMASGGREARESAMNSLKASADSEVKAAESGSFGGNPDIGPRRQGEGEPSLGPARQAQPAGVTAPGAGLTPDATSAGAQATAMQHTMSASGAHGQADGFLELYAHYLEGMAKSDGVDHAAQLEVCKKEIADLVPLIKMQRDAESLHKQAAFVSEGLKHKDWADHHIAMSEAYAKSATRRADVSARLTTLVTEHTAGIAKAADKKKQVEKDDMEAAAKAAAGGGEKCPNCGAMNKKDAATCEKCGKSMTTAKAATVKCSKCDASMPTGASKCAACGQSMTKADVPGQKTESGKSPNAPGADASEEERAAAGRAKKAIRIAASGSVTKGMSCVAELAYMLDRVKSLQSSAALEQFFEGDTTSTQPAKLQNLLSEMAGVLQAIVTEETSELLADEDVDNIIAAAQADMVANAAKSATWHGGVVEALRATAADLTKVAGPAAKRIALKKLADQFEKAGAKAVEEMAKQVSKTNQQDSEAAVRAFDKFTATVAGLTKEASAAKDLLKARDATIQQLQSDITVLKGDNARLASMPLPNKGHGPGAVSALKKADDVGGTDADGTDGVKKGVLAGLDDVPAGSARAAALLSGAYIPRQK